jgi:hypothetical protein
MPMFLNPLHHGRKRFTLPLLLGLLAGCGSGKAPPAAPDDAANQADTSNYPADSHALDSSSNVVHASFSGDINRAVTFRGDDVEIGYIPSEHGALFSIGGTQTNGGEVTSVALGPMMGIELKPGPARSQDSFLHGGMITSGKEDNPDDYSSAGFDLFYATTADGSDGQSTLVFDKVEKEPSSSPMLTRYHLVGRFTVHTGHPPEPLSKACAHDAVMAVANDSNRLPRYNAKLCNAKRADVTADFDVRVELADMSSSLNKASHKP